MFLFVVLQVIGDSSSESQDFGVLNGLLESESWQDAAVPRKVNSQTLEFFCGGEHGLRTHNGSAELPSQLLQNYHMSLTSMFLFCGE